jgi:hypothetical protein
LASVGTAPGMLGETDYGIRELVIANYLQMGGKPLLRQVPWHLLEVRHVGCLTCGASGFRWIDAFGTLFGRDDVLKERLGERVPGLADQTFFGG